MKTKFIFAAIAILLLSAGPVLAVSQPGCGPGEFFAYAEDNIGIEQGGFSVTGNFISLTGFMNVGAGATIHGTAMAANLFVGTGALVDVCATNNKTGPGTCGTVIPFDPTGCSFPPIPVPTFPAVCNNPGTDFTASANTTIPEGCYNKIRVNAGITALLVDGGTYFAKGEVRLLNGSTIGATGAVASLTTKSIIVSEPKAKFQNVNATSLSNAGNAIVPGNQVIYENAVMFAPFGGIHVHAGSLATGVTEFVGEALVFQPITNEPPPNIEFCTCRPGTVLAGPAQRCIPQDVELQSTEQFLKSLSKFASK